EMEWIWGSSKVPACHKNSLLSHLVRMIPFSKAFTAITRYLDAALKESLGVYHDSVKKQVEVGPVYALSQAIDQRLRSVTSQIEKAVGAIPEKGERDMTDQALATLFNGYVLNLND